MAGARVTPAMRELLAWLAENGMLDTDGLRGGTLVDYYRERAPRGGLQHGYATTSRMHAWRRTGGRLLGNMHRAGLLVYLRTSWGTPEYRLTDEAKALARGELAAR